MLPSRLTVAAPSAKKSWPFGLDVLVEQHLLAGDLGVLVELRRRPVVGIGYRATAVHAVLLALEAAAVVPPVAAAGGHRQVGLLGAGLDLVEDLLPQRRQVVGDLLGVGVLGLQVVDDLGVGLVAQPLVGVDEDVAVMLAAVLDPFGDGRCRLGHASVRSSRRTAGPKCVRRLRYSARGWHRRCRAATGAAACRRRGPSPIPDRSASCGRTACRSWAGRRPPGSVGAPVPRRVRREDLVGQHAGCRPRRRRTRTWCRR